MTKASEIEGQSEFSSLHQVIDESDVSIELLQKLFTRAFCKCDIDDDGDLYITDGLDFPIWASIDEERTLIKFFTYLRRETGEKPPFSEAFANHLNATVVLPTFFTTSAKQEILNSHCFLTYASGVIDLHIITTARRFAGASAFGARKIKTYGLH